MVDQPPPNDGLNFFVPWSFLEYAIGGIFTAGATVAAWVWRLANRVGKLEDVAVAQERTMRELIETKDRHYGMLQRELENLKSEIPDKHFIEAQFDRFERRLDGVVDRKGEPR